MQRYTISLHIWPPLLLIALLAWSPVSRVSAQPQIQKPHVIVLNSYNVDFPWTNQIVNGVKKEFLRRGITPEYYFEFMDTKHIPATPSYFRQLAAIYSIKYRKLPVEAKRVAVINGNTKTGKANRQVMERIIPEYRNRLPLDQ